MRSYVLALAVLIVGVSAWPQSKPVVDGRDSKDLVIDVIVTLIEEYSRLVRESGLDPYRLDNISAAYSLPVDGLFSASASISGLAVDGLADVAVNALSYDSDTGVLSYDVAYTYASGAADAASAEVNVLDFTLDGSGSGSLEISNLRFVGTTTLTLDGGIKMESFQVAVTFGSVESNINLNLLGTDLSDTVNNFLGVSVPEFFVNYEDEISIFCDYVVPLILNTIL